MTTIRRLMALTGIMGTMLVAAALTGCGQSLSPVSSNTASITPAQATAQADEAKGGQRKIGAVKIALLLPTGGYGEPAQIARGMKQAAEMALFEADNPAIQLIPKDDGGTPQGAARAAEAVIGEGAEIILGPLFSSTVHGVAPVAQKAGVPVLAFSNDANAAKPGVYLMSFLAAEEVRRVIDFAAGKGKRRFAALIPATAYGKAVEPAFRAALSRNGAELVASESYAPGASNLLEASKRVLQVMSEAEAAGRPVDALFLPAGPDTIGDLGPMLAYAALDSSKVKLIGTSAWDLPAVSRDERLIGGWYAAADPDAWTSFSEKFQKTFGTPPPRLATLAYDAMGVALDLASVPAPARYAPDRLTRAEGFTGVDGAVRLTANGLSERSLAVLEVEKYKSVVVDPAPRTMAPSRISSAAAPGAF